MNWKKTVLSLLSLLIIAAAVFIFLNKDKITYVGSVDIIEVDCSKRAEIIDEVYKSDQRIREADTPFKEFAKQDHANQELIISIVEKCGFPTLNEVSQDNMNAIWTVLQHSKKKYRKKYFPKVEAAVNNGDLSKAQYATMKDRILMDDGKPQIYGTQIKNGKLYKLDSPKTVNERRAEMGLKPIEEYLEQFNIEEY